MGAPQGSHKRPHGGLDSYLGAGGLLDLAGQEEAGDAQELERGHSHPACLQVSVHEVHGQVERVVCQLQVLLRKGEGDEEASHPLGRSRHRCWYWGPSLRALLWGHPLALRGFEGKNRGQAGAQSIWGGCMISVAQERRSLT